MAREGGGLRDLPAGGGLLNSGGKSTIREAVGSPS